MFVTPHYTNVLDKYLLSLVQKESSQVYLQESRINLSKLLALYK